MAHCYTLVLASLFCSFLFSCQENSTKIIKEEKTTIKDSFETNRNSKQILSDSLWGKQLCRQPTGPDDKASFELTLAKTGQLTGEGVFFSLEQEWVFEQGNWRLAADDLTLNLEFTNRGSLVNKRQLSFELSAQALLDNQAACMDVHVSFRSLIQE